MNGMQNPRMGGTWHSSYSMVDRQKVVQILAATLKEIQNTNYNEQKALAMAQEFEKFTFAKSTAKEEYLNIIKQKVTQLRMGMRNAANSAGNTSVNGAGVGSATGPGGPVSAGSVGGNTNVGNADFSGQNMAMYAQNRQQQQGQPQHQPQQRQGSVANTQQQQQQQQIPQGLQPTQQQIQQIGQVIRTSPIPPALLSKLPNLPPNVNTWTRIYECLQKKIIPASAMPVIKEVHNAHFQLAVRQHQQQKLTQMRRANAGGANGVADNSAANIGAESFGANNTNSMAGNINGMGVNSVAGMDPMANRTAAAKNKINNMAGTSSKNIGNMNNMGSMNNMGGMGNMGNMNMNNMNNMGNMGNVNGMNNMGVVNGMNNLNGMSSNVGTMNVNNMGSMNNMNNMNNMGAMNNVSNLNGMGNMNVNRQVQSNPINMQSSPQMGNQNFRGNQIQNSQSQPQQSMQPSMGMQNSSQSAPLHQQQNQLKQQQQQQQQQAKPPNFQITSQDLAKYSPDAMALLNKLQQNGSIQTNLDPAQKQNFVRKFISHQKLNAWKAQQKGLAQNNVGGQQEQQQQMQRQQQQKPTPNNASGYLQQQQQQQQQQRSQTVQPSVPSHVQLQSPTMQQMGQPNANPMMGQTPVHSQNLSSTAQRRSLSAQAMPADSLAGGGNVAQQRMSPGSLASVMPALTDEMKMKLRALFEEVARNSVHLKDVTMLLSDKEKIEVKESMARITQQYSNIDSILSYYYVLTRNIEGTKRLIQMKNMTKNIIENLQVGIYLAGPDLLEKIRIQYQKHLDFVKEELTRRRAQQARTQSQNQPLSAPVQSQQARQGAQFSTQQFASQVALQQPMQQNFGVMPQGMPVNNVSQQQSHQPQQQQQQQQQQQHYMRNNANAPVQSQRAGPNSNAAPVIGSSPALPNASSPATQGAAKGGAKATKKPAARKKSVKGANALPTPVANAATPATLANAIKTPNSISTPQIPASQSAKGTPNSNSPPVNSKPPPTSDIVASTGDVFGSSNMDKKLMKRRELSKSNPEEFFFAALSNMLELDQDATGGEVTKAKESKKGIRSPLSPLSSSEWSSDVKSQAITSAFRQVEFIAELTGCDILQECADLATKESQEKEKRDLKRKREEEEDDDMDLLFEDKKFKMDDDMEKRLFAPIELDDWKSWLGGLQKT